MFSTKQSNTTDWPFDNPGGSHNRLLNYWPVVLRKIASLSG